MRLLIKARLSQTFHVLLCMLPCRCIPFSLVCSFKLYLLSAEDYEALLFVFMHVKSKDLIISLFPDAALKGFFSPT